MAMISSRVVVINYMEPIPSLGSRSWRLHQIASILSLKFDVVYLRSFFDHFSKSYKLPPKKSLCLSYNLVSVPATPYFSNASPLRILSYISFAFSSFLVLIFFRPRVVIASFPHGFSVFSAALYKLIFPGSVLVVDIRDKIVKNDSVADHLMSLIDVRLSDFWSSKVDFICGPASCIQSYLPQGNLQLSSLPYYNVPFCYAPPIHFDVESLLSFKSDPHILKLVFAGTLTRAFDLLPFIELTSILDIELTICGDGPMYQKYRNLAESVMPKRPISFFGRIESDRLSEVLAASHVGLLPYDSDNFSSHFTNKFAEYLYHGCTLLVGQRASVMSEFAESNELGFSYSSLHDLISILGRRMCLTNVSFRRSRRAYEEFFSQKVLDKSIYAFPCWR